MTEESALALNDQDKGSRLAGPPNSWNPTPASVGTAHRKIETQWPGDWNGLHPGDRNSSIFC